jgi:hypothetical protein
MHYLGVTISFAATPSGCASPTFLSHSTEITDGASLCISRFPISLQPIDPTDATGLGRKLVVPRFAVNLRFLFAVGNMCRELIGKLVPPTCIVFGFSADNASTIQCVRCLHCARM